MCVYCNHTPHLGRDYPIAGTSETLQVLGGLIDSGFAAEQVYALCAPVERAFFPANGWDHLAQPVKEGVIEFLAGKNQSERQLVLIHFDDFAFKGELYLRLIQDRQGPPWHIARRFRCFDVFGLHPDIVVTNLNRPIPSRMARNNSRRTATSAI